MSTDRDLTQRVAKATAAALAVIALAAGIWQVRSVLILLLLSPEREARSADGLPVLDVDAGGTGVVARSGDARYVTMPANQNTVLARVNPRGGRILASRLVRG